ncbi:MAG: hypothetical protein WC551_11330 [Patescibacteria group bacterium]
MAWTQILSTQTDANSPLNQVLFDAIRNDLDHLRVSKGELVADIDFPNVNERVDGAVGITTTTYPMGPAHNYVEYDVAGSFEAEMVEKRYRFIPVGCATIRVFYSVFAEVNDASIGLRFYVGSTYAGRYSIPAAQTSGYVDIDASAMAGTMQQIKITAYNGTGTKRYVRLYYCNMVPFDA